MYPAAAPRLLEGMTTARPTPDRSDVLALARLELIVAAREVPVDAPADAGLVSDLGVDPVTLREFVARLEYRYGISVPESDRRLLGTLDEVASYVVDRTADQA
jgi:acyl carrier protein